MAGCLRSAVHLALRTKLIETIGRLPGVFEKLHINDLTYCFYMLKWWRCRDLNPGHCGYEPHALTD
jgi:hypothetical protein